MFSLPYEIQMRRFAAAAVFGASGAVLASALHMPAPYITGPAIAVTLAGLGGIKTDVPVRVRDFAFVVIGLGMGTSVTPDVMDAIGQWPVSLTALGLAVTVIMLASRFVLTRWWGQDGRTAVLAATPGHLSYVLGMTDAAGLDVRMVAIVQSIRLLFLTLAVPPVVILLDTPAATRVGAQDPMGMTALATSLLAAAALGLVFKRLRLPAAFLIAGMVLSTATHLSGVVIGALPQWLSIPAFTLMGMLIGTRFSGVGLAELRSALSAGLVVTGIGIAASVSFALAASWLTGFPLDQMLIALAPGGVETMSAMAQQMHADPTFVATHHVARLFMLTFLVPFILGREPAAAH